VSDDVTLLPVFRDLLRRWKVVVVVATAVLAGATVYAESEPNEYQGTAIVAFSPRLEASIGGDTLRVVLPKYVAYVTAGATVNRVAPALGENASQLGRAVSGTISADSGNLTIRVTLASARRAAGAANALAGEVVDFADTDELLRAVIVAPALPSSAPSGPPRRLLETAALLVGLLVGAAAAFVLERGRPRVRTWREVAVVTGYRVVGRIPPSRVLRGASAEAMVDPAVGAAIRTLRTNLERLSREQPVHVLVVTSSLPGEGKTTVSGSLAVALARLDANILLVDADLRRPGMAKLFGGDPRPGLAEVLRGDADLEDCIRPGSVPGLHLLLTESDPDAGDLLARGFADVLRAARRRFDVVVVDAPPLLGGDDARTLTTLCDGVLLVVASDTLATAVAEAAAALDALGARVLGAVANRAREPRGTSPYGSYGTYGTVRA
jgi:tyrosine-protein kinase